MRIRGKLPLTIAVASIAALALLSAAHAQGPAAGAPGSPTSLQPAAGQAQVTPATGPSAQGSDTAGQDDAERRRQHPSAVPPPVPEPATLALAALGLGGLGFLTRRRAKLQ